MRKHRFVLEKFPRAVDRHHFAAAAETRIDAERGQHAGGGCEQQFAQVLAKGAYGSAVGLLFFLEAHFPDQGMLHQSLERVVRHRSPERAQFG